MKKILVIFLLLAGVVSAQTWQTVFDGTVANSASKTTYVFLDNEPFRLDSVKIQATYTGEIDIDKLIVTKGSWNGSVFTGIATPDTTTLTVDNAAAAVTAASYTAASTALTAFTSNAIKIVFISGSAGNDATDPNRLHVKVGKFYTR